MFAKNLDRAEIDEAFHVGTRGVAGEPGGGFDIAAQERAQRVGGGFLHDMHARRTMDDNINIGEPLRPVGMGVEVGKVKRIGAGRDLIGQGRTRGKAQMMTRRRQPCGERLTNETAGAGEENGTHDVPVT
ncbi:hypothetical protein FACS189488_14290 [Betaproteobacteria bacterium]|nr:hypothetical protein FACS189488_14290 [Betaproteobacteria bacterium]